MYVLFREVYASDDDDAPMVSRDVVGRYATEPAARKAGRVARSSEGHPNATYTIEQQ